MPATHILEGLGATQISGAIAVNESEFTSEDAKSRLIPINDWLSRYADRVNICTFSKSRFKKITGSGLSGIID